jgi:D-sedoheptulose 7-phosphate isomerase
MEKFLIEQIKRSIELKRTILEDKVMIRLISEVSERLIEVYRAGNKTLIAGNGGSAADAQHLAGEFVSKFYFDRAGLPSIALSTDTSVMTAIGNDYGFENLFARQIQANGVKGDFFIGLSTSGDSPNILKALEECQRKGIISLGLTGQSGGRMAELCDYCIKVPSRETPRVQESHIMIGHILCSIVEEEIFGSGF